MGREHTKGIALISVILAVALIAMISAGMIANQHVDIHRTTNLIHRYQAYEYALGVESWATRILARDSLEQEKDIDHPGEAWAQPLPPTDITGGMLTGRIEDLQARINLNNLDNLQPEDNDSGAAWGNDPMRFRNLLAQCGLEPDLIWPVVDWIDGKDRDEPSPGGAEDYTYLGLDIPYRSANTPMADPSELVLVRGFEVDGYKCLAPFISALPEYVPVNVNTASAPVLMAVVAGMTETQAEQIVKRRETQPYESVDTFIEHMETMGISGPEETFDKGSVSVTSNYYLVVSSVRVGNTRMDLLSRVKRASGGGTRVLSRDWGAGLGGRMPEDQNPGP
uniref:Type II secretion system protein K n=1 Tax=Candidatus Kentrum sp. FW TaxID=2126338 RepID=A0A450SFQ5_9GAMM|nr:MAG: general secretion pathway protein K [Candidatus Kentron sp. FW]VFJ69509.1 MAG: general secretion pathway protein K [Candidatus Kentron sp. FW]